jgi:biotin-(acetyl-CoA carboxylase) ligase
MRAYSHGPNAHGSSFTTGLSSLTLVVMVMVLSTSCMVWFATASGDEEEDGAATTTCEDPSSSSTTGRPRLHPHDESLLLYPFDSLVSTQNEAKRIAESISLGAENVDGTSTTTSLRSFVVTTREQTNGRGTNGRVWMGHRGNVFCTIGIRQQDWMASKIPLTLLPLKIGSLVAQTVQRLIDHEECHHSSTNTNTNRHDSSPLVTVKWPNDVLVNEQKISGVLIESSNNGWFLIGIGINLAHAPEVAQSGPNRGRPATSVKDICTTDDDGGDTTASGVADTVGEKEAEELGISLAYDLNTFLQEAGMGMFDGDRVLQDWKQWIDWDMELVMRDTPGQDRVKMVGVLPDGRIQVQNVQDGRIRTLVSDYFL